METLWLKGVKSYSEDVFTEIDLSNKINIFFGQNGSGKSTISGYFYSEKDPQYSKCRFETNNSYRYIVYNSQFIEDSFYNKTEQPGIFTLSNKNKETIKLIESKKTENERLQQKIEQIEKNIKEEDNKIESILTKHKDNIWSKTHKIRSSDLKPLLTGYLKKNLFYTQLKDINIAEDIDLDLLVAEHSNLITYKKTSLNEISIPKIYQVSHIQSELLNTSIISSDNSYLSGLINKLDNSDWVHEGINYIKDEKCPFCQNNTIDQHFKNGIKLLFDNTYNENLKKISVFHDEYKRENEHFISFLKNNLNSCNYIKNDHEIWKKVKDLEDKITTNINKIINKKQKPSAFVKLIDVSILFDDIMKIITRINSEIKSINQDVANYNKSEDELKSKLWRKIRFMCNDLILNIKEQISTIEDEKEKLIKERNQLLERQNNLILEISKKEREISNIDETIDSINKNLISLGIDHIKIAKHKDNNNFFQLVRENGSSGDVYQSLSEGEKTIITFLYFIELCLGSTSEVNEVQKKLIVIDDPISSLSLHYIYEIASLINYRLLNNNDINKILILTHNLFFYKEIVPNSNYTRQNKFDKQFKLYKVVKNEFSIVETLDRDEIKTDYQYLWMILKDAKNEKISSVIVPNIMRNILEYYFSFQCANDKLNKALDKLNKDETTYENKAFYRYMNNGSHFNSINSYGTLNLPVERYFSMFEKIFKQTDNLQHYQEMIQNDSERDNV